MLKKKILIIGGTGFIGYHLAQEATRRNWTVHSLSKKKPKNIRKVPYVKYIYADISKINHLKKKIKSNYSFVVNLGGYVDHSNKKKIIKDHFNGCKNLCEILNRKKLITFVQMGSSLEYGKLKPPHDEKTKLKIPRSNYAKSKFMATNYLINLFKKDKFPAVIFRLYQTYGPYQDENRFIPFIIKSSIKNLDFPCSNGNQSRDFVYIKDLIDCIFLSFNNSKSLVK